MGGLTNSPGNSAKIAYIVQSLRRYVRAVQSYAPSASVIDKTPDAKGTPDAQSKPPQPFGAGAGVYSPRSFFPALTIDGSLFFSPASIIASPISRAFKEGWLATGLGSAAGVSGFIKSFLCNFEG